MTSEIFFSGVIWSFYFLWGQSLRKAEFSFQSSAFCPWNWLCDFCCQFWTLLFDILKKEMKMHNNFWEGGFSPVLCPTKPFLWLWEKQIEESFPSPPCWPPTFWSLSLYQTHGIHGARILGAHPWISEQAQVGWGLLCSVKMEIVLHVQKQISLFLENLAPRVYESRNLSSFWGEQELSRHPQPGFGHPPV